MESVLEDIGKISEVIRKKHATLRNRARDRDLKIQERLKPVTDPLANLLRVKNKRDLPPPPPPPRTPIKSQIKKKSPSSGDEEDEEKGLKTRKNKTPPLRRLRQSTRSSEIFGIREEKGQKYIGNQGVTVDGNEIILEDGTQYVKTPGLMVLLTNKNPLEGEYNNRDLDDYRDILERTSAHRINYEPEQDIRRDFTYKYMYIIKPLFNLGSGLHLTVNDKNVEYRYWGDVNELVDRLMLLHASKNSGHEGHHNEITSIISQLRDKKVIA